MKHRKNNRKWAREAGGVAGAMLLLAASLAWGAPSAGEADTPVHLDAKRQVELLNLIRQDCGACHGLRLTGGLGPPLLPESLRDKPFDALKQTILFGRPGTPMPPWRPFLTDAEAQWIVQSLLKGLPDAH
jgi:cytochrome c55X